MKADESNSFLKTGLVDDLGSSPIQPGDAHDAAATRLASSASPPTQN